MKVLLLTQVVPYPPDSGPKVKTYNVLQYLARRHEVTLVSFARGDQTVDAQALRRLCRDVTLVPIQRGWRSDLLALARSLAGGQPWMMVRDDQGAMRAAIREAAAGQQFDVVHADQLNMAQFAGLVPGARKVLDTHNALWLLYRRLAETMPAGPKRWLLERDWRLLKEYESRLCRSFDHVTTVSQEDRAALVQAGADPRKMTVIPITVDCDTQTPVAREAGAGNILHIGTMYWPPNIDGIRWFARDVLPLVRQVRPGVIFDVVGARPPEEIRALSGAGTGINVTGYVEDPQPYLRRAGVMVVPLRAGGGMRVKILNAMAQAMPIVTTRIGCEGIEVKDGRHVLIADTPADFAAAVEKVLADSTLARRLGENGRRLVLERYDYRVACRPLDDAYRC